MGANACAAPTRARIVTICLIIFAVDDDDLVVMIAGMRMVMIEMKKYS